VSVPLRRLAGLALCIWAAAADAALGQQTLIVEDVRVHGNHSTPDEEVLRIAAIVVGTPVDRDLVEGVRKRLEDSGRFSSVEIRQRSRSIEDPTRVALIILVAEHAAVRPVIDVDVPKVPGVLGRLRSQTMFLPILSIEDGYGLTYGLRTSFVGGRQSTTRLSVPASWGGTRQLALEAEKSFTRQRRGEPVRTGSDRGIVSGGLTRLRGSAGLWRQEHPYFEQGQFRQYVDGEISYRPRPLFGVGATAGLAAVAFGDVDDRMTSGGLFAEVDTRRDPLFPRNAVYARTSWTHLAFDNPEQSGVPDGGRERWQHDLRGYVGVIGQLVLAARVQLDAVSAPLPAYAQPIFGGADTLRGIRAGYAVGDNLWSAMIEARAPITSVLRTTRFGVLGFYDTGATWNHGQRWRDAGREEGVGAGIFLVNPFIQLQVSVARGLGRSTRVHVSTGVSF
jgi:outer membrane protein assembly factor BamA